MEKFYDIKTKEELILDYRPPEPKKNINTNIDLVDSENLDITYSQPINKIDIYKPSFILNGLNIIKDNIISMETILDENLNYKEEKIKLTDEYYKDINSDFNLEIYKALYDTLDETEAVKDTIIKINYGEVEVNIDKLVELDKLLLDKIKSLEISQNTQSINYFSIYIDSQINKLLSFYVDTITNYTLGLNEILIKKELNSSSGYKDILLEVFKNTCDLNSYDRNKLDKLNIKNMLISYINQIYFKKEKVSELMKRLIDLDDNDTFIKNELQGLFNKYSKELFDLIIELSKIINLNSLYKNDYLDTLKKKCLIKDTYNVT